MKDFNGVKIVRIIAKRAFNPTNIPGADYVLNPYVGCAHGCIYCYAKFMGRFMAGHFLDQGESLPEWGKWVAIKENFTQLVEKESRGIAERGKAVYMASVSDAYQPIEGSAKIVRKSLEAMDRRTKLSIIMAMEKLARKGIPVYAFISPIIPGHDVLPLVKRL